MRRLQLTGQKFNRITVLSFSHVSNGNSVWNCTCDCGREKKILANDLRTGNTTSCGCVFMEIVKSKPSAMKGKNHKEDTKILMRKAHSGKKYALGTKHTKQTRDKQRLRMTGSGSPSWKGGVSNQKRKKIIAANGGFHSRLEWEQLKQINNYTCLCCGRADKKLTKDHIVPITLGGSNDITNIQPLCLSCNIKKRAKIIDYAHQ